MTDDGALAPGGQIAYLWRTDAATSNMRLTVLDARTLKVIGNLPIEACDGPTGIALDRASNRIFAGCSKTSVVVDVALDEKLARSVRNIAGIEFVASARLDARSVMNATKVVATRGALEKLQEVLA